MFSMSNLPKFMQEPSAKQKQILEKLHLDNKLKSLQEKMNSLENQSQSISTKIWPPNKIKNAADRSKAHILYAILMILFLCWTMDEFLKRIISSIKKPVYESTFEKESFNFPVVTICGSEFMTRAHTFTNSGCLFYNHEEPGNSVPCTSKVVEELYWNEILTDYSPPCVVFNAEAQLKTVPDVNVGLDVWVSGTFEQSNSNDDLWADLTTYSVFLSEKDLDDPTQKDPGFFVTNTMTRGFSGYRVSKAVNTGASSVFSATVHSQVPGGNSLELLLDVNDDVQYLVRANPWADSYLIFGAIVGVYALMNVIYRLFRDNVFKWHNKPSLNEEEMSDLVLEEGEEEAAPAKTRSENRKFNAEDQVPINTMDKNEKMDMDSIVEGGDESESSKQSSSDDDTAMSTPPRKSSFKFKRGGNTILAEKDDTEEKL